MEPVIDYTDKDFRSLRQAMFDLAAYRLPEWTDRSPADLGVLLVDLFAYMGDVICYYQDRIAAESFLDTASERRSVINLLRLVGYELAPPTPAATELTLTFRQPALGQPTVVTVPTGTRFRATISGDGEAPQFEFHDEPRLLDLSQSLVHTLPVRQARSIRGEILGSATGEAAQSFRLAVPAVIADTLVVTVDEGAGPVRWERRDNLLIHPLNDHRIGRSGPESTDYYLQRDELNRTEVIFGDTVCGRPPRLGIDNVRASYAVTLGAPGNVLPGTIAEALDPADLPGLESVTNLRPASGGADAESIERAARFGPLAFRSGDRAVTLNDYVTIALQAGGVAKVRARTTGWNRVDLIVAPEGETFTPPPPDLRRKLVAYFEDRRMVGTSVRVQDPIPVPVDVTVEVVPEHNHAPQTVQAQAERAVRDLLAFRRVEFGRPLYLSKVYEAVEALPGVAAATVTRFCRTDTRPPPTLRRRVLLDAGLGEVSDLISRVYGGAVPVDGRIAIGEIELPVPATITVTLRFEAP